LRERRARSLIRTDGAMKLAQTGDPTLLLALRADLASHAGCVVTAVGHDTLEATILGSYDAAMEMVARLRVRAWEATQRAHGIDVCVQLA
jgi:hypothetical protein